MPPYKPGGCRISKPRIWNAQGTLADGSPRPECKDLTGIPPMRGAPAQISGRFDGHALPCREENISKKFFCRYEMGEIR